MPIFERESVVGGDDLLGEKAIVDGGLLAQNVEPVPRLPCARCQDPHP
jgi:hypothetical protein